VILPTDLGYLALASTKDQSINRINFMQFFRFLRTIVSETVKMSKTNWINRLIFSRLIEINQLIASTNPGI